MLNMLELSAERLGEFNLLHPEGVVKIGQEALRHIDDRLMTHGDRVAFIACELMRHHGGYSEEDIQELFLLALFHDIGIYKINEVSKMLSLERVEVMEHSLYGYLFLKNLSPLGEAAKAVLYHHTAFVDTADVNPRTRRMSQFIHLADQIDILMMSGKLSLAELSSEQGRFDPELLADYRRCEHYVVAQWRSGSYRNVVDGILDRICSDVEIVIAFLAMLVYVIDFKSAFTVDHTINTIAYAVQLGRLAGLSEREQYCLYLGALVHDIGKIGIPYEIIEFPGRLTTEQMEIMKTHVVVTDNILRGNIPDEIRRISARHHEKPDGSGYPEGLVAADTTLAERVMAVADVMSALLGRRSYKENYDVNRTVDIIAQMAKTSKLDAQVCKLAIDNVESLIDLAARNCEPIIAAYHNVIDGYEALRTK